MATQRFQRTAAADALNLIFSACDEDRAYTLFDARDAHSYGHGHIPGAVPLTEHAMGEWLQKLSRDEPVFIYCGLGFSSQTFAKRFADSGFSEVHSIDGGFSALAVAFKEARAAALASEAPPEDGDAARQMNGPA
jgi:thiosulfate sulfurtransferase